jgi:uncharacterized repeat protein (TIGR01451 family)
MGQSGPTVSKRMLSSFGGRFIGALLLAMLACAGVAQASSITVNKQFGSNTINLGATTSVTITLENGVTTAPANISAFTDDISTMGGVAAFATPSGLATTCVGGNPTISGTQVLMTAGQIPQAPDPSDPGTCTITFNVVGAKVGSGGNQIIGTNVVTDQGSPSSITQTLVVNPVAITTSGSGTQTIQAGTNGTVTFTINNPAVGTALTNATIPLVATGNGTLSFQITGGTTTCGAGTVALPPAGTSGTATVSGATIPAGGNCTVTLTITTPSVLTVNVNLASSTITDDQLATNSGAAGASTSIDKFVLGQPNISKSFTPTTLAPGSTVALKINIQNILSSQNYTNASITDTLPASLTLVSAVQNANCVGGTVTGVGTGTITVGGGMTMNANSTCTITATVQVPLTQPQGGVTNTIPAASFTSDQVTGAAAAATASLTVTAAGGGFTQAKSFSITSVAPGQPSQVTLTFTSVSKDYTGAAGSFTDPLPATPTNVSQLFYYTDATHVPSFTAGCGAGATIPTATGATSVTGSMPTLAMAAGGTCVVKFWVEFTTPIPVLRTATNTITTANVTLGTDNPTGNASANISEMPALSLTNYVASAATVINQPLTVQATINDPTGVVDGSLKATFPLNTGALTNVVLAPNPNFQFSGGCPTGISTYLTGAAGATTWSLGLGVAGPVPSLSATCTITYNVIDNGGVTGSFGPGTPILNSNLTGNTNQNQSATQQVTWTTTHLLVNKKFTPNQIQAGSTSVADITVTVAPISGYATTEADVIGFADALPSGMTFAPVPNVLFSAGCQQTGQPAPSFVISGATVTFSNVSVIAIGTTPTNCDVTFNVTSSTVGAPLNSIGATTLTSEAGITNPSGTSASLTVQAGVAVQKTFTDASFPIGGSTQMRLLLTNSASTGALTGGTLSDVMPAGLIVGSNTPGSVTPPDPVTSCGATIAGSGTATLTLTGITIGGVVGTVSGTCVEYILVKAAAGATAGLQTNTIPAGGLNIGGFTSKQPATGSVTLTVPPNIGLAKAFAPTTIAPTGVSVLTITITNTAAGSVPLSGMAFTDTLPTNITNAAAPSGATTCGTGTVTAVAAGSTVSLAGGTIAAGATCTVTVNVTGTVVGGPYTNTIPTGGVTTTEGASNPAPATAPITIANAPNVALSKAFLPVTIAPTGISVLTITVANTGTGAVALSGMALTDNLPTNITIAATPNASTTCGAGTVGAVAGATSVSLAAGSVAAAATCTITVSVTGTVIGNYTNTIPTGGLTSTQGASNPSPVTAPINIQNAPSVNLTKAFNPVMIAPTGISQLTITIANTMSGAVALTNMALTDTLPTNITIANPPVAATTCGSGIVTAAAGGSLISLASASVAAAATCTITLNVTGSVVGNYLNTIPANTVTTTQGAKNPAPATAPIAISNAPGVTLTKAFNPVSILPGGTSVLTISIADTATGAVSLTGMNLTDTLPTNITVATTPAASTTCGSGTVTATAGATSVALVNGGVTAGTTCTITVTVTGTTAGNYTNTIPAGSITSTQGGTNPAPGTAPIAITNAPNVSLAKAFNPTMIDPGGTSLLTITISNTAAGALPLTGVKLTDTLPTHITIAKTPNAATTCPSGLVGAAAGSGSVVLTGASLATAATCTITVNVTGTISNSYLNTIPAGGLTSNQGATNPVPVTAPITIGSPSGVILSKAFSPNSIPPGGTSKLTITIANTRGRAQNLTGMALSDTLPAKILIASPPDAATTCGNGSVVANAGHDVVALRGGSIAKGATCTITVNVTGKIVGDYVNTIPKGAVHTHQGASNPGPANAPITISAPKLSVTKKSDPDSGTVDAGDTISYTIAVTNSGTAPETNATIDDRLHNATLVPGSVRVDGKAAPDGVVTSKTPFGSVPAGKTVTITYKATVKEDVQEGAQVTNGVTVGGSQPCTGPSCSAVSPPVTVAKPGLKVIKRVDGKLDELVVSGQIITYGMHVTNTGGSDLDDTVLTDNVPVGVTPVAGSVTIDDKPQPNATVVGQLVTVHIGKMLSGSSVQVDFKAKVEPTENGPAINVVTVTAKGLKDIISNPVTLRRVGTSITVTKVASATAATVGDRVDYVISVVPPVGVPPLAPVTIVDILPGYEFYAPGTARLDGKPFPPVVAGQNLTWTIPKLLTTATIFYSTVVGPGVPANSTLTNVVDVTGQGPPGSKPATGTANAAVLVLGTSIGSCYPITGRVYLDVKDQGRFIEGDIGVPAVYVYLDDGEYVVTDGYGRYDFPCVRPGMHALRLDESTLPPGITPFDDRNIDSERSNRRLVHRVYDQTIIEDINFAVKGTPVTPIVSPETKPSGSPAPPGFPPP